MTPAEKQVSEAIAQRQLHIPSAQCWCKPIVAYDDAQGNPLKVPVIIHNTESPTVIVPPPAPKIIMPSDG